MILSVIIPVYNIDQYLPRCLNSILEQSLEDFELILVNDGSVDKSQEVCESYAKYDPRIKVINKINEGLSVARNTGIKIAKGEYILFIDGDDFIVENTFSILVNRAKSDLLDILVADAMTYVSDDNKRLKCRKRFSMEKIFTGEDFLYESLRQNAMLMCAPMSLYRREFILKSDVLFKPGLLHEDELWTPQIFLKAKRVEYIDFTFYMHFKREGSITQKKEKTKNAVDLVNIISELAVIYSKLVNIKLKKLLYDYLVMLYLSSFYIGKLYRKDYKPLINKKFVWVKSKTVKNRFKAILFCLSPFAYYYLNKTLKNFKTGKTI